MRISRKLNDDDVDHYYYYYCPPSWDWTKVTIQGLKELSFFRSSSGTPKQQQIPNTMSPQLAYNSVILHDF
jgi:hypothetical protein